MTTSDAVTGRGPLLKPEEIARLIGVDKGTVLRLRRKGAIPAYRVGGQFRFDADEVLAALRDEAA